MIKPDHIDERDLLVQLQQGDRVAFEKLYHQYAPKLTVKLLQLVKSEDLAQDLLQDIFLKIWQMRADLKEERSFAALLYTMATNLSLNSYRTAVREQNRIMQIKPGESYSHIEEDLQFAETNKVFNDALSTLTDRQREVYMMHKLEGKSYKEISDTLKISHSAINQHLQLANKQIRLYLQNHLPQLLFFIIPFLSSDYFKS
ncbi:sigma-70 family RNA polymerase sigma factor [Sphingobacterium sp. WM]|uniref:RNA polymerase sigma factor n=1 Tax=Sphingobacterium sp. WM TaxID=3031802 RepID=UPI00240CF1F7|nr:sigma-70 family RNA polymerase sigma factor [Sphingobacterium sp. WM]WFB64956.1 sigma-70 family RNA polymerase sigma factor [Sphingobacterium sp. WM]